MIHGQIGHNPRGMGREDKGNTKTMAIQSMMAANGEETIKQTGVRKC